MQIIEQQTIPKARDKKNEDALVITNDFVAVIDGSTSKSSRQLSRWQSNGRLCMKIVRDYIRHMPPDTSCEAFCRGVSAAVRKRYGRNLQLYADHPEERIAASCIVYSRLRRQIWMVGDCQCLVGRQVARKNIRIEGSSVGATHCGRPEPAPVQTESDSFEFFDNPKPYEQELAYLRAAETHRLIECGEATEASLLTDDKARQTIIPRMKEWMRLQNIEYAVIDGFTIPMDKVRILTLDFEPWTIVLASDGYPFLLPSLEQSEEALAQQKATDPLNIGPRFRATKAFAQGADSFDDRTYVKLNI